MGRMVVVGGEVSRRGLWGGNRTGPEWIGLSIALVSGMAAIITTVAGTEAAARSPSMWSAMSSSWIGL